MKQTGKIELTGIRPVSLEEATLRIARNQQLAREAFKYLNEYDWENDKRTFIWTPEGQEVLELLNNIMTGENGD